MRALAGYFWWYGASGGTAYSLSHDLSAAISRTLLVAHDTAALVSSGLITVADTLADISSAVGYQVHHDTRLEVRTQFSRTADLMAAISRQIAVAQDTRVMVALVTAAAEALSYGFTLPPEIRGYMLPTETRGFYL